MTARDPLDWKPIRGSAWIGEGHAWVYMVAEHADRDREWMLSRWVRHHPVMTGSMAQAIREALAYAIDVSSLEHGQLIAEQYETGKLTYNWKDPA
jgi:hypothetical protein